MIKRVRMWAVQHLYGNVDEWPPKKPFVLDARCYDITTTVCRAIKNLPASCVAVSVSRQTERHRIAVEAAAKERGVRVMWTCNRELRDLKDPNSWLNAGSMAVLP